jgi:hypothetical protein
VDGTFEPCAAGGRVLILLMALLIAVSPWTEYYWHFDNFPRGGQDFEFSLLCTITVFCLVLVLLQHGKQGVTFWFALRRWLSVIFRRPDLVASRFSSRLIPACCAVHPPGPTLGVYDLPLRI